MTRAFAKTYLNADGSIYNEKTETGAYKNFIGETKDRDARLCQTIRGADYTCKNCGLHVYCWEKERGMTLDDFHRLTEVLKERGSVKESDIADRFLKRCCKMGELSHSVNRAYRDYLSMESARRRITGVRSVVAGQFAGLSDILHDLSEEFSEVEGYDEDWQNADKERMARYADVPGGTYRFKVKAFLLESPDKYDMRTVEVIVPAHFLISSTAVWCYIGAGAIVITALLFAYQNRLRKRKGAKDKPTDDTDDKAHDVNDDDREIKTDDYEIIEPDNE
jgi:hypothetical protein